MTTEIPTPQAQTDIKVLDHGHVQLIDYMGSDLSVVNAARVSFNKESSWDGDPNWTGAQKKVLDCCIFQCLFLV